MHLCRLKEAQKYPFLPARSHESPVEGDELMTIKEYIEQVTSMKTYGKTTLYIDFTHLSDHSGDLAASLIADYYR